MSQARKLAIIELLDLGLDFFVLCKHGFDSLGRREGSGRLSLVISECRPTACEAVDRLEAAEDVDLPLNP